MFVSRSFFLLFQNETLISHMHLGGENQSLIRAGSVRFLVCSE